MKRYTFLGDLDMNRTNGIVNFILECKRDNEAGVLLINSGGGSTSGMTLIYETLVDTGIHLTTIGVGMVASAAANIFAMGDERILLPGTEYLIHQCRDYFEKSSFTQYHYGFREERLKAIDKTIIKMLAKTKITEEVFEEKCSKGNDWLLTYDELKKYGVITKEDYKGWTNTILACMQ